ncbi:uncharacterized protein PV07_09666 [Cladophialophora immunda]|uniref:Uncharacterized protein n=1 Tax=Cladophialophora immunda TaxID=569365 RepID=A0A0D2C615_9EURO|nr:uncharacterized protein PV07_09666 [Cladophialophora immunda]KIW26583.1 hypothetical protein PV07_09666 [Cladophialophora immunda]OQV02452.1 hypothetical protein CLAIMM_07650 isoform 1 [Cladophialophora immunda]
MSSQSNFLDTTDWPLQKSPRQDSITSLDTPSDTASVHFTNFNLPPTPALSGHGDRSRQSSCSSEQIVHVPLNKPVNISFSKGSKLFKLKYAQIQLRKDVAGQLKQIELSDPAGLQTTFMHSFPGTKMPIPHLETPVTSSTSHISRVSFLEEQNVRMAATLFQAQPSYTFETWEDCVHFQEALLSQTVIFTAGIAEAKSKGRGEECISQNLRILRSRTGRQIILFFANSQRKEKKRYITIPLDCIDHIEQSKKSGRPMTVSLRPNFDLLAQLKALHITFLDDNDQKKFFGLLCHGVGFQG